MKVSRKHVVKFILGIKLKQLRKKVGLSLKELAEKSGLSASYLNEIEKGKKYPKLEKITSIAGVLDVPVDDLASARLGVNLNPLTHFVESELFNNFPLEMFGINDQDIYDLMSFAPEKFASFLVASNELARSYDITVNDVFKAALRSYQERFNNYFVDLENLSLRAREEFCLNSTAVSYDELKNVLESQFNYIIDEELLVTKEETKKVRSYFKSKKNKSILLINKDLSYVQKKFVLAKELGHCYLGVKREEDKDQDFNSLLADFRASYFSGALCLPANQLVKELRSIFQNDEFSESKFLELLKKYEIGSEVLMNRLTQILPEYFGVKQLYFLKMKNDTTVSFESFTVSKELHLSQMHAPHGQSLKEHYCRRWITISLLQELAGKMNQENVEPILGIQRSKINETEEEYFCVSIARPSKLKPGHNSCITIGILVNDDFKKNIRFWSDSKAPQKVVGQTCERCSILDCEQRLVEPVVLRNDQKSVKKAQQLDELINDL